MKYSKLEQQSNNEMVIQNYDLQEDDDSSEETLGNEDNVYSYIMIRNHKSEL